MLKIFRVQSPANFSDYSTSPQRVKVANLKMGAHFQFSFNYSVHQVLNFLTITRRVIFVFGVVQAPNSEAERFAEQNVNLALACFGFSIACSMFLCALYYLSPPLVRRLAVLVQHSQCKPYNDYRLAYEQSTLAKFINLHSNKKSKLTDLSTLCLFYGAVETEIRSPERSSALINVLIL